MQLYLLLNTQCNLSCSFCIRGNKKSGTLDSEKWYNIIKNNNFSQYELVLTGGEPSLYSELPSIINESFYHFKRITINTNGIQNNWISSVKIPIHIQISLDGHRDIHNFIRAEGKSDVFSKIICTIDELEKKNISYNISTTVNKFNYFHLPELHNFLLKLGNMKFWKISPQLPFGCASNDHVIGIDKWNSLVDYLLKLSKVRLRVKKLFDFSIMDKYIENPKFKNIHNCGSLSQKVYIYPDLTVYPCTCLTDFPLGSLITNTLDEVLLFPSSLKFIDYKPRPESKCTTCKYLRLCNSGCIGMSWNTSHKLGMGDPRCPLLK